VFHPQISRLMVQAKIDDQLRSAARHATPAAVRHETQRERVRQSVLLRPEPRPADGREV
jgi:hypothetical protein